MGSNMANNLMKKGHKLIVYDTTEAKLTEAKKNGATIVSTPQEVSKNTQVVVTVLPAGMHVRQAYLGENGLLKGAQKDSVFIDCTTCEPSVSQAISESAESIGANYLDAPISGGVVSARDARLTFMVGGRPDILERVRPLLEIMGKNVIHCGDVGMGVTAKICNNMMLGIAMIGTSEAMSLGIKLGIDPKKLANVMNVSSGRSWCSDTYNPCPGVMEAVPSSKNYEGGFATALMTKDLNLSQNISNELHHSTPLGSLSLHLYRIMCRKGFGEKDFSYVLKFLTE